MLLSGERVALNYLQRMSGIATYTREVTKLLGEAVLLFWIQEKQPLTVVCSKNMQYA